MQRLIPIIAYLSITISVVGQPIITKEVLPKVGDTILMASDNLPENIAILGEGASQSWDMMKLQSAFTQKIAIKEASGDVPFAKKGVLSGES